MSVERIKVFVRIKPSIGNVFDSNDTSDDSIDKQLEYNTTENQFRLKNKIYTIDSILSTSSTQANVYHTVAIDQIDSFLQGFNATIFAYGQTGSGKTHTIFGPSSDILLIDDNNNNSNQSLFGLVPRCFLTVFERLQDSNNIKKHQILLSCVEVYNTSLNDLFQPSNTKNLKIREDIKKKSFFVEHLTEETIQTQEELLLFIKRIQLNRAVSATNMNKASSRSHVLLQLTLIQQLLTGETKQSLLTFVDLAGSEMVGKSGVQGVGLKEAGYINSSLTVLSRVIEALGMNHSNKKKTNNLHIPFRDSSLTKLLKNTLGGNCKTSLIVCVSEELKHKEETHSSLRFATRAACVKTEPVINKVLDAQELYKENLKLKAEIQRLTVTVNDDKDEWFQQKLKDLDLKEQEVEKLKAIIEELNLKLERIPMTIDNNNNTKIQEIQNINNNLNQQINELKIKLSRETHSKNEIQQKYIEKLQVIYSEVASQKLFEDSSDVLEQLPVINLDHTNNPKQHKSIQPFTSDSEQQELKEMFIKYMPNVIKQNVNKSQNISNENNDEQKIESIDTDDKLIIDNLNPTHLVNLCKKMHDKIENLEIFKQETNHQYKFNVSSGILDLNVTDTKFVEKDFISPTYTMDIDNKLSYHIYKNESGTEVSFDPLSSDEEILIEKDIQITVRSQTEDVEKKEIQQNGTVSVSKCDDINIERGTPRETSMQPISNALSAPPISNTGCSMSFFKFFKYKRTNDN